METGNRNAVFIDDEGERRMAVVLKTNEDGSANLTYQAGSSIHTVTAVFKDGAYRRAEKPSKEQA
jgi:hypothetical protein